jgi:hypothetical protein
VTLGADDDIKNHFNWCYNKVCDEYKKEELYFGANEALRTYFYQFYYHQFYKRENQDITLAFYDKFWRNIFEINKQKNKNVINTLLEIYAVFDASINQEKNILQIV